MCLIMQYLLYIKCDNSFPFLMLKLAMPRMNKDGKNKSRSVFIALEITRDSTNVMYHRAFNNNDSRLIN